MQARVKHISECNTQTCYHNNLAMTEIEIRIRKAQAEWVSVEIGKGPSLA